MRTTLKVMLMAIVLLLANTGVVGATDFCLDVDNGGNTFVLKAFLLPGKGICKGAFGFAVNPVVWLNGSACGSSDGVNITFTLVATGTGGVSFETNFFKLHRASLTTAVDGHICSGFNPGTVFVTCTTDTFAKTACAPSVVPIPQ